MYLWALPANRPAFFFNFKALDTYTEKNFASLRFQQCRKIFYHVNSALFCHNGFFAEWTVKPLAGQISLHGMCNSRLISVKKVYVYFFTLAVR
jgi:hypothetical protein